jgi:GPH family glycoside/pentoside/hexuronide:cation symporter
MLIVPFFYALGYSGIFNVLSTMMADVTDLDELRCGERREGMFGAVMSVINKSLTSVSTMISGVLVVAVGFEITKGAYQDPGVFQRMLIFFSIVPAITGTIGFLLLRNYPLTRARVGEIKELLAAKRLQTARNNAADASEEGSTRAS